MPYLVLDLEMTGPEPDYNEIIQLGAVLYDDTWLERGQYLTNVYPENKEALDRTPFLRDACHRWLKPNGISAKRNV